MVKIYAKWPFWKTALNPPTHFFGQGADISISGTPCWRSRRSVVTHHQYVARTSRHKTKVTLKTAKKRRHYKKERSEKRRKIPPQIFLSRQALLSWLWSRQQAVLLWWPCIHHSCVSVATLTDTSRPTTVKPPPTSVPASSSSVQLIKSIINLSFNVDNFILRIS